jgi:hypothetical protein
VKKILWYLKWLVARFRLNPYVVCEMSRGRGLYDFHDYSDTDEGKPDHFVTLRCRRCGKLFCI